MGARIKEQLLTEFGSRTECSPPTRRFLPTYLFFDRTGPTEDIWYYEHPLPEGRKNYTKTKLLRFNDCISLRTPTLRYARISSAASGRVGLPSL